MSKNRTIAKKLADEAKRTHASVKARQPRQRPSARRSSSSAKPKRTLRDPLGIASAME